MNKLQESYSAEVLPKRQSEAAKQAEDVRSRWGWTDPGVWTDRMLTALENGVKGGQWFSLIDKVYAESTLYSVGGNGLTLHPEKTRVVDSTRNSFEFLGYRFLKHRRYPRRKSQQKFKDAIRAKTRRTNGRSLTCIIGDVNRTMVGWFEYFQHTSATSFRPLDQFVRQRLRAILLKRLKRKFRGPPRGLSYTRWTIAYFDEQGLFNLTTALARKRQSLTR